MANDYSYKVVFLDRGTVPGDVVFPLVGENVKWEEYQKTLPAEVIMHAEDADICVVNKVQLHADVLKKLPRIKMIALCATGSDNIGLDYCREHGIIVSNIVAYGTPSIVEHVFMMMLAIKRNLLRYRQDAFARWPEGPFFTLLDHPIQELKGSVLGIIGRGELGQAVGCLGEAFGMKVLYSERKNVKRIRPGYTEFSQTLKMADVLTLHVPLNAGTKGLIAAAELASMKAGALLINTARGGIVDEAALVAALREGRLGGAGLDVTRPEPPRADNLLLTLSDLPNVILTPHIAWGGGEALVEVAKQVTDNIKAFLAGQAIRRLC